MFNSLRLRQWIGSAFGSDNGLSPIRRQAIIYTNAILLSIGPLGTKFSQNVFEIQTFFIQENASENVVCEMADILFRPHCVNGTDKYTKTRYNQYM